MTKRICSWDAGVTVQHLKTSPAHHFHRTEGDHVTGSLMQRERLTKFSSPHIETPQPRRELVQCHQGHVCSICFYHNKRDTIKISVLNKLDGAAAALGLDSRRKGRGGDLGGRWEGHCPCRASRRKEGQHRGQRHTWRAGDPQRLCICRGVEQEVVRQSMVAQVPRASSASQRVPSRMVSVVGTESVSD